MSKALCHDQNKFGGTSAYVEISLSKWSDLNRHARAFSAPNLHLLEAFRLAGSLGEKFAPVAQECARSRLDACLTQMRRDGVLPTPARSIPILDRLLEN